MRYEVATARNSHNYLFLMVETGFQYLLEWYETKISKSVSKDWFSISYVIKSTINKQVMPLSESPLALLTERRGFYSYRHHIEKLWFFLLILSLLLTLHYSNTKIRRKEGRIFTTISWVFFFSLGPPWNSWFCFLQTSFCILTSLDSSRNPEVFISSKLR